MGKAEKLPSEVTGRLHGPRKAARGKAEIGKAESRNQREEKLKG